MHALLEDAAAGLLPAAQTDDGDGVLRELRMRGITIVEWDGWQAIEEAETSYGAGLGRGRTKLVSRAELLRAAART